MSKVHDDFGAGVSGHHQAEKNMLKIKGAI